jgi:Holliday junction resolvasome RuvABC endonuclease subunit
MCGYGRADKSAIRKMVMLELNAPPSLRSRDAIDALAIAVAGWFKRYD